MNEERKFSGKTVLIVDDSDSVRRRLEATYSGLGLKVVGSVSHGLEALAVYEQHRPDLVSLDIIMPVMDGIECFRKLSQFPHLNPLFVSALSSDMRVVSVYQGEIEPWRFVGKPVTTAALVHALEIAFGFREPAVVATEGKAVGSADNDFSPHSLGAEGQDFEDDADLGEFKIAN